jgi:enterochelin esterase-like enzyme
VLLRLADPDGRYAAVRLCSDLVLPEERAAFARADGEWRLDLGSPPVARLEYELEVTHPDGTRDRIEDPENPQRAPGAFGDKSVLLAPGYEPPPWLDVIGADVPGEQTALEVPGRGLGATVELSVWSPAGTSVRDPLPLLVANDGPEYERLAGLTRFAAAGIRTGALPAHRIALLAPGARDEWYSASARYASALADSVLPAVRDAVAVSGPVVAMGASLGALAMLHAQRTRTTLFGALFLQSGSYVTPRFDAHESGFGRYQRIVRFVGGTLRGSGAGGVPVPVTLTCGSGEENLANNRLMAAALAEQGYDAALHEVPDTHNFTAWRDALDPHLTGLLARVW